MIACPNAGPARTRVTAAAAASSAVLIGLLSLAWSGSDRQRRRPRARAHGAETGCPHGRRFEAKRKRKLDEPAAAQLAGHGTHPREYVPGGLGERSSEHGERGEDRDRVPVNRPDE